MKYLLKLALLILVLSLVIVLNACKETEHPPTEETPVITTENPKSCEGCHTDFELLKRIATPDTGSAGGGCGGEIPEPLPPHERAYLSGEGFKEFKASSHGKLACTYCHNGVGNTGDKAVAHGSGFISHPSTHADEKCNYCHAEAVAGAKNSLHQQGWGQKSMVATRFGGSAQTFENLPSALKKGYNDNCSKCHATCGDCHVMKPKAIGGGLYKGHKFVKTPSMTDQCIACHSSRGGHAFLGLGAGTVPDVHFTNAGFTCLSCHTKHEVHGNGNTYNQRYQMPELPKCSNCHAVLETKNAYHSMHINTMNCNTCHSQDYNNCGSCHVAGDGARIVSHLKFKIGMNPIPETKSYKFATLRESLMAPDSWEKYSVTLPNFDLKPTYKYATPHNIQRWTVRTKVAADKACYDNCHIIKEGTNYRNKQYYLFNSDLNAWEVNACKPVVVDGKLPSSWGL
ncbi:MAG: hypothetical protein HYV28_01405 [Ignavibacteriales bacterium]|nr:hypothetical protein [Ignavibacteriales bacterium]